MWPVSMVCERAVPRKRGRQTTETDLIEEGPPVYQPNEWNKKRNEFTEERVTLEETRRN